MEESARRRWAAVSLSLVVGLLATGCGGTEEPQEDQMVLIAGARQGVPSIVSTSGAAPEIVISSLSGKLEERFDRDMTVSVIPVDGDAQTQATQLFELDTRNSEKREASDEKSLKELSAWLAENAQASSGEANLVGALDAGGRATASATRKDLYVYDSGISTAGPLAMQNGVLGPRTDVSTIVEQLQATGNIPQAEGVTVHWWGLGQVASPQADTPVWARTKLKELWTAVVEAGGGSVVFYDDAVEAAPPAGTLPEVTRVDFGDTEAEPVAVSVPESQVAFRPDTAEFADAPAAERALAGIAATLKGSSVPTLWVTGCTANPADATAGYMQQLSERRARTVAGVLMEAGVETAVRTVGMGPACPGRTPETGDEAEIETARAQNRKVLITSAELSPAPVQD